jgi:hypothetical protein
MGCPKEDFQVAKRLGMKTYRKAKVTQAAFRAINRSLSPSLRVVALRYIMRRLPRKASPRNMMSLRLQHAEQKHNKRNPALYMRAILAALKAGIIRPQKAAKAIAKANLLPNKKLRMLDQEMANPFDDQTDKGTLSSAAGSLGNNHYPEKLQEVRALLMAQRESDLKNSVA